MLKKFLTFALIGQLVGANAALAADTAQVLAPLSATPKAGIKQGSYCSYYGKLTQPLYCPDLGKLTIQQIYARGWRIVAATVNSFDGERIFIIEEQ